MEIEIKIDANCPEPKLILVTDRMTEELTTMLARLSDGPELLAGFRENGLELLDPSEVLRVYGAAGKVCAATEAGEYTLRLRLYEAEERLARHGFVRISHSELINLKKAERFDLSLAGTICVKLKDGSSAYVSRRYVYKIKRMLGI